MREGNIVRFLAWCAVYGIMGAHLLTLACMALFVVTGFGFAIWFAVNLFGGHVSFLMSWLISAGVFVAMVAVCAFCLWLFEYMDNREDRPRHKVGRVGE